MKIGVLTSSRADYGIYLPLLKELSSDSLFDVRMLVFGSHLSKIYGNTVELIKNDGYNIQVKFETLSDDDTPEAISKSMARTVSEFSHHWGKENYDLVLALGDRYEMFAAVTSGIPFNLKIAHIHGGETSLGSIDNIFRHSITLASKYHFVSCRQHGLKVAKLTGSKDKIFNVGALGLDNIKTMDLLSKSEFYSRYKVDLSKPTLLLTIHPETHSSSDNKKNVTELVKSIECLRNFQFLITLPNTDSENMFIREQLLKLGVADGKRIFCFKNLGTNAYLSAMKNCSFLIGNSSSGIIEAASLGKWVIDLGERQKGRMCSKNVFNVPFEKESILKAISKISRLPDFNGRNIYSNGFASKKIVEILKEHYEEICGFYNK